MKHLIKKEIEALEESKANIIHSAGLELSYFQEGHLKAIEAEICFLRTNYYLKSNKMEKKKELKAGIKRLERINASLIEEAQLEHIELTNKITNLERINFEQYKEWNEHEKELSNEIKSLKQFNTELIESGKRIIEDENACKCDKDVSVDSYIYTLNKKARQTRIIEL